MRYALTAQPEETDFPHELCFGSYDRRCVHRDGEPYLCVRIPEKDLWVDEDALVWGDWLLIGTTQTVYCIRLEDLEVREIQVDGYFKTFLAMNRRVFFFEATGMTALDEDCHILWQNHGLALDGCLFCGMCGNTTMVVSCEMDPPGGWIHRTIDLRNGELL